MTDAIYNPLNKPVEDLPFIYGFNNGGRPGFMHAQLVSQEGVALGSHICSDETYMPYDLGIRADSRPDRHVGFRLHYPDGYRMSFVCSSELKTHTGLQAAFVLHNVINDV
jgi:hypothetical protein